MSREQPLPNESLQLTMVRTARRGDRDHARALAAELWCWTEGSASSMGWFNRKRKVTAPEFTAVLAGVLTDVLKDHDPHLEEEYLAFVSGAGDGQVKAEVFALGFSLVAQAANHIFRQKGSSLGASLDLWMSQVLERLPATETRKWFLLRADSYADAIVMDIKKIDDTLRGERRGVFPFQATMELFLEEAVGLPEAADERAVDLSVKSLVPIFVKLQHGFDELANEVTVVA